MNSQKLNIKEIFYSLQGESSTVGKPTVFVRLVGCPLRCTYCDSEYAFYGNNPMTIDDILAEVSQYNAKYVCVTGGEPLAQNNCGLLIDELVKQYNVSIETSGAMEIKDINQHATIVMDIKTPSSGEMGKNMLENLAHLKANDELKFVIGDENDFNWSVEFINKNQIPCEILFSSIANVLSPTMLAEMILKHNLDVRMQVQLHKILWGDVAGK